MESFNLFSDILKKGLKYGKRFTMLAKQGDYEYLESYRFSVGKQIPFTKDMKRTESERMLNGDVLIYDKGTESLDWKALYKNTKGIYFKKQGKNYYI